MIMCVLLCYPVSIHMSQVQATGRPISSFLCGFDFLSWCVKCTGFTNDNQINKCFEFLFVPSCGECQVMTRITMTLPKSQEGLQMINIILFLRA